MILSLKRFELVMIVTESVTAFLVINSCHSDCNLDMSELEAEASISKPINKNDTRDFLDLYKSIA